MFYVEKSASRQSVCSLLYSCFVWAEYIKLQCARLKPREEWYYGCELYMCLHLRCFKSGVVSRVICVQDPGSMGIPMYIHLNQFVFNWIGEVRRLALPLWTSTWTMLPRRAKFQVWCGVACDLCLGFWFNRKTHVHTSQPGIFQSTCKEISPRGYVCGLHRRIRRILHDFGRLLDCFWKSAISGPLFGPVVPPFKLVWHTNPLTS